MSIIADLKDTHIHTLVLTMIQTETKVSQDFLNRRKLMLRMSQSRKRYVNHLKRDQWTKLYQYDTDKILKLYDIERGDEVRCD